MEAVVEFARAMHLRRINEKGEYVIIAVHEKPYEQSASRKYMLTCMFAHTCTVLDQDMPLSSIILFNN